MKEVLVLFREVTVSGEGTEITLGTKGFHSNPGLEVKVPTVNCRTVVKSCQEETGTCDEVQRLLVSESSKKLGISEKRLQEDLTGKT